MGVFLGFKNIYVSFCFGIGTFLYFIFSHLKLTIERTISPLNYFLLLIHSSAINLSDTFDL